MALGNPVRFLPPINMTFYCRALRHLLEHLNQTLPMYFKRVLSIEDSN